LPRRFVAHPGALTLVDLVEIDASTDERYEGNYFAFADRQRCEGKRLRRLTISRDGFMGISLSLIASRSRRSCPTASLIGRALETSESRAKG
jgi:hypothetical protein